MWLHQMDEVKENETMYVKYEGDTPVAYAYGEPWVAQALFMDDISYPTEEAARAAWERWKARNRRG